MMAARITAVSATSGNCAVNQKLILTTFRFSKELIQKQQASNPAVFYALISFSPYIIIRKIT